MHVLVMDSNIRLICGDCNRVMTDLSGDDAIVDCVIADLPYYKVVADEFDNQWKSADEYLDWVDEVLRKVDSVARDNANIILFASRQMMRQISNIAIDDIGWTDVRTIIWARKRGFNSTRGHALASGYEPILHFCKGDNGTFNNIKVKVESDRPEYTKGTLKDGVTLSDVWTDIPALPHNSKEKVAHPTQKPVKLMERIVSLYSNPDDLVLDFCMGSGSTGIACRRLGRKFIGIERDESFYEIARQRMEDEESGLF